MPKPIKQANGDLAVPYLVTGLLKSNATVTKRSAPGRTVDRRKANAKKSGQIYEVVVEIEPVATTLIPATPSERTQSAVATPRFDTLAPPLAHRRADSPEYSVIQSVGGTSTESTPPRKVATRKLEPARDPHLLLSTNKAVKSPEPRLPQRRRASVERKSNRNSDGLATAAAEVSGLLTEQVQGRRSSNSRLKLLKAHALDPLQQTPAPTLKAQARLSGRRKSSCSPKASQPLNGAEELQEWHPEYGEILAKLVGNRKTITIHWKDIAGEFEKQTGKRWSPELCEARYMDSVAEEYTRSARAPARSRVGKDVLITPAADSEFKAHDPTKKFKMTKVLEEKNFREHPPDLMGPWDNAEAPRLRRYSFINDTLDAVIDSPAQAGESSPDRRKSQSLLNEVLPTWRRPSLKLENDRFLQKLKHVAAQHRPTLESRREASVPKSAVASKRRVKPGGGHIDNIVREAALEADELTGLVLTRAGLNEELIALENCADEANLINEEIETLEDDAQVII